MSGHKTKITGMAIKDGKLIPRPVKLSRPAHYAKRKKQTWRSTK